MDKYRESDFQNEIKNIFVNKGWNNIGTNLKMVDETFFRDSLSKYLQIKYSIFENEIQEIFNNINNKLSSDWFKNNKIAFLDIIKNGISTELTRKNNKPNYKIFDFSNNKNNNYEIADEVWITKDSRMDIVLFVNGLPIFTFELKSIFEDNKTLKDAFNQIKGYLETDNPKFATFNIAQIVAKNYNFAKIGSICTKSIDDWYNLFSKNDPNSFFEIFKKIRISNYLKWGVLFSRGDKRLRKKIILRKHQYEAILKIQNAILNKKGGYIWHTQGSGKTVTISALISSFKFNENFASITSIIDVDRKELVSNMYNTLTSFDHDHFDGEKIEKATSRNELKKTLSQRKYKGIIISTTQKFGNWKEVSDRQDLIIISDEAHRSHSVNEDITNDKISYLEKINQALPNALRYGVTGTPIFETDKSTYNMFGELLHTYTMKQAEIDEIIVPLQVQFIDIPLKIKNKSKRLLQQKFKRIKEKGKIIDTSVDRLDFITDKIKEKFLSERANHNILNDDTLKAMVVTNSREQGYEIYKILRNKIFLNKEGKIHFIATDDKDRKNSEIHKYLRENSKNKSLWSERFKNEKTKIEMVVVVDMLLTGYNVPNLRLMFLDKEIQKHNLLQAISRANRKFGKKRIGTIFSFRDIKKELEETLRVYRETTKDTSNLIRTSKDAEERIKKLVQKIHNKYKLDMMKINFNEKLKEMHDIKNKYENNRQFIKTIQDIINLSTLVIKWKNEKLRIIVLLFKLILKTKQMASPSFIDITEKEFNDLLNSIQVNKKLVKETRFATLDEIFSLNISKKEIVLNIIKQKITEAIKKEFSFSREERETLLMQLEKIIKEYNGKNLDYIREKLNNFNNKVSKNSNLKEYTKLMLFQTKKIIRKELKPQTLNDIDKIFSEDNERWRQNPATKGKISNKIFKAIEKNEVDIGENEIIDIIHFTFEEIKNRGYYGY